MRRTKNGKACGFYLPEMANTPSEVEGLILKHDKTSC